MDRRQILAATVTLSATTLAGCTGASDTQADPTDSDESTPSSTPTETASPSPTPTATPAAVELVSKQRFSEEYAWGAKGVIKNTSERELPYVQVTAKFYDSDGRRIAEGLDNVTDLGAGREWAWRATTAAEMETEQQVAEWSADVATTP